MAWKRITDALEKSGGRSVPDAGEPGGEPHEMIKRGLSSFTIKSMTNALECRR
jgi:hypothetical protein